MWCGSRQNNLSLKETLGSALPFFVSERNPLGLVNSFYSYKGSPLPSLVSYDSDQPPRSSRNGFICTPLLYVPTERNVSQIKHSSEPRAQRLAASGGRGGGGEGGRESIYLALISSLLLPRDNEIIAWLSSRSGSFPFPNGWPFPFERGWVPNRNSAWGRAGGGTCLSSASLPLRESGPAFSAGSRACF